MILNNYFFVDVKEINTAIRRNIVGQDKEVYTIQISLKNEKSYIIEYDKEEVAMSDLHRLMKIYSFMNDLDIVNPVTSIPEEVEVEKNTKKVSNK